MNDIDLSGVDWLSKNFAGEFNGNGHVITNLNINSTTNNLGFFSVNTGTIKNVNLTNANVSAGSTIGILAAINRGTIENCSVTGEITATGAYCGGLVGKNEGTIKNVSASGEVNGVGDVGGLVGKNQGTITNASASCEVSSAYTGQWSRVGGFVGRNSGVNAVINNASALGSVLSSGGCTGGFVGHIDGGAVISSAYSLGDVNGNVRGTGGFAGEIVSGSILNSYAKGNVSSNSEKNAGIGGFLGWSDSIDSGADVISGCYSTGNVQGKYHVGSFAGMVYYSGLAVSNSYSTGTANNATGTFGPNKGTKDNCYVFSDDESKIGTTENGVTYQALDWFEDGNNLTFLGDAYDYYYNPPELWSNLEYHPEEYAQFQVGANSGEKNQLEIRLMFRMNGFYGDVTSVDAAAETLERVDNFKNMLVDKRAEIGAVRNRMESVLESQSIRLENLSASYSTIVDTDFAQESASLVKSQILQNAANSLLKQANFTPNIALQLLS